MYDDYVAPILPGVHGNCYRLSTADYTLKKTVVVELTSSPYDTVHWQCSCRPSLPVHVTQSENRFLSIELTFSSITSQTKVPLKDTIKGALRGLDIDPFQLCGSLSVVGNCCPVECLPTVAEETFQWMKTLLRNDKGYVKLSTYRFTLSESWPHLRPSQLYQASILNCIRRAIAEGNFTLGTHVNDTCSSLFSFQHDFARPESRFRLYLQFSRDHESSIERLRLLERDVCLLFVLGLESSVDFAHSLPVFHYGLTIEIIFCEIFIPVVSSAVKYLLNTLSYFHTLLPINGSLSLFLSFYRHNTALGEFRWQSIWPVHWSDVPKILLYYIEASGDPMPLRIRVEPQSISLLQTPRHLTYSSLRKRNPAPRNIRHKCYIQLLPKS